MNEDRPAPDYEVQEASTVAVRVERPWVFVIIFLVTFIASLTTIFVVQTRLNRALAREEILIQRNDSLEARIGALEQVVDSLGQVVDSLSDRN